MSSVAQAPLGISLGTKSTVLFTLKLERALVSISNLHGVNTVFLAFSGHTAVLNKGMAVLPKTSIILSHKDFPIDQISALASAASTAISFQEFV